MSRRPPPALVAAVVVAAIAAAVTFLRLGEPPGIVFDETYYVGDARSMLDTGTEAGFAVHPPLGKWVIAAGIALVGDEPTGWRAGGAFLAVLAVAATVELGRRLTGRIGAGVVAGALVLLDGVWLSLARLAMLDSSIAAFVTFGTLALVVDHQRATARASDVAVGTVRGPDGSVTESVAGPAVSRWPLWLAGAAFGAATTTKWSGVLALGGAALLALGWEIAAHRRRGTLDAATTARATATVGLALALVPLATYALAWLPWLAAYPSTPTSQAACTSAAPSDRDCDHGWDDRMAGLIGHHTDIARFHLTLAAEHPYRAPATTWPAQLRPVVAHYESCDAQARREDGSPCLGPPGRASEVAILGNPALWWSSLLLVPLSAAALRRRDGSASVPLVLLGTQFVPWLVAARPVFNFYTAPLVPALAVAVVVACAELDRPTRRRATLTLGATAACIGGGALLASGASGAAATTAGLLAAVAGVATGSLVDGRRERTAGFPARALPVGTVTAVLVLAAAVALLLYLSPLWLALPVEASSLRQRWWLRSWV